VRPTELVFGLTLAIISAPRFYNSDLFFFDTSSAQALHVPQLLASYTRVIDFIPFATFQDRNCPFCIREIAVVVRNRNAAKVTEALLTYLAAIVHTIVTVSIVRVFTGDFLQYVTLLAEPKPLDLTTIYPDRRWGVRIAHDIPTLS